ncbi:tRNA (guanine(9)-N(1))-methyltransferase [Tilletia horrida]|uniref:tRNA (guanine(9)-N1)-methyltransferase n=1 Tax=Tilletia horrida TaxID=155126 RepID=A0AAN6GLT9_9BASI|nr:tRNA (guanine(9)-N(1))-methyltransferase [Tilletia horrida]KAK0546476.1 tRNA (guanine(9)-N(1))-methyltransferase [Tilletia horrida]KAK0562253.1 tRNA (guanine(9)-N(1))-methyltransferase [Tilletia horrida]
MEAEQSDTAAPESSLASGSAGPQISKRAQKRLAREQRWEDLKPVIKAQRKEKLRIIKEQKRQKAAEDVASGLVSEPSSSAAVAKVERTPFRATLVIDLGFDHLMNEKEIKSLALQLTFVYAANRRSTVPFEQIVLAGGSDQAHDLAKATAASSTFSSSSSSSHLPFGKAPTGVQLDARTQGSWRRWRNVHVVDDGNISALLQDPGTDDASRLHATFAPQDVIYLTADSENVIHQLEEGKAYVLGGIVDKNRYKNLCFEKAQRLGVQTAQLPISDALFNLSDEEEEEAEGQQKERAKSSEAVKLRTRKVLTVNQVADILIGWNEQRAQAMQKLEAPHQGTAGECEGESAPTSASTSQPSALEWDSSELERWWRAAVRKAFPRRKLKERTPRRKPRNDELAAAAASHPNISMDAESGQPGSSAGEIHTPISDQQEKMIVEDEDELYNAKLQT